MDYGHQRHNSPVTNKKPYTSEIEMLNLPELRDKM